MSFADIPADTDAERIVKALDILSERQDKFAEGVNNLGANVQWIVDNVQGLFQMFANPQFMAMLPGMMNQEAMSQMAEGGGNTDG